MQRGPQPGCAAGLPALMLSVQALKARYRPSDPPVIEDLSFTLPDGGSLALLGPSGCGKTTLLHLLCGVLTPEHGELRFDGEPLTPEPGQTYTGDIQVLGSYASEPVEPEEDSTQEEAPAAEPLEPTAVETPEAGDPAEPSAAEPAPAPEAESQTPYGVIIVVAVVVIAVVAVLISALRRKKQ